MHCLGCDGDIEAEESRLVNKLKSQTKRGAKKRQKSWWSTSLKNDCTLVRFSAVI